MNGLEIEELLGLFNQGVKVIDNIIGNQGVLEALVSAEIVGEKIL